jgi:hypothetical protein
MSQQQESLVPRPPPVTISLPQAQRLANLLQAARDEFVSLVASFPPGHPQIRSILNRYPELRLQELERVLDEGRRLLAQIREDYTHRPNRQRVQAEVELHGRVQRQYTRLRDMLDFVTEDLDEFNHLRVAPAPSPLQNLSAPSRPAGQPQSPAQPLPSRSGSASLFASPSPPRAPSPPIPSRATRLSPQQPRPASPAPPQSSEFQPSDRRRRSYQELLEENRELRVENMLLSQQLRRADRLIASWSDRREEHEGEEEEEEEEGRGGKRRRL